MSQVTIVIQNPGPPQWIKDLDAELRAKAEPSTDIPDDVANLLAKVEELEYLRFFSADPRQMQKFIDRVDQLLPELLSGLQRLNKGLNSPGVDAAERVAG